MISPDLTFLDVGSVAVFYQFTLYMAIRLAHHSFTLGELGLTAFGATILFVEAFRVTMTRVGHQLISISCLNIDEEPFLRSGL